jgi:hypothetical protein
LLNYKWSSELSVFLVVRKPNGRRARAPAGARARLSLGVRGLKLLFFVLHFRTPKGCRAAPVRRAGIETFIFLFYIYIPA